MGTFRNGIGAYHYPSNNKYCFSHNKMNFIDNLIEIAKENPLLVFLNKKVKKKKEIAKRNEKKYWKLPASERLHYDSVRNKIDKDHNIEFLGITFSILKIFGFLVVFLAAFKILTELDSIIFIKLIVVLIPAFMLVFKVTIVVDLVIFFINYLHSKPKIIKYLNERYGFK